MRWEELFADIEFQFEQQLDAERLDLAAETERVTAGRMALARRLGRPSRRGESVRLTLTDAQLLDLRVESAGADWVAGEVSLGARSRGAVVPISAIAGAITVGGQPDPLVVAPTSSPRPDLADRLGLAFVMRDLSRKRIPVELRTTVGSLHGTIDRVAADHLEFAERDPEDFSRPTSQGLRLVPYSAILVVLA